MVALHRVAAPTTYELYRLHGVAKSGEELRSGDPADLVESLQKLSLWAWSGQLCSGGFDRGSEDLDRLFVGDGATI